MRAQGLPSGVIQILCMTRCQGVVWCWPLCACRFLAPERAPPLEPWSRWIIRRGSSSNACHDIGKMQMEISRCPWSQLPARELSTKMSLLPLAE